MLGDCDLGELITAVMSGLDFKSFGTFLVALNERKLCNKNESESIVLSCGRHNSNTNMNCNPTMQKIKIAKVSLA